MLKISLSCSVLGMLQIEEGKNRLIRRLSGMYNNECRSPTLIAASSRQPRGQPHGGEPSLFFLPCLPSLRMKQGPQPGQPPSHDHLRVGWPWSAGFCIEQQQMSNVVVPCTSQISITVTLAGYPVKKFILAHDFGGTKFRDLIWC